MNPSNKPQHSARAVICETIKRDREALDLKAEVLAAVAGVKLELLLGCEAGTYNASEAMHLELMLAIRAIKSLRTVKSDGPDLSNAASLRNLVHTVYWGYFSGRPRLMREWQKTFEEMRERQEVVSDDPPFLHDPDGA